MEKHCEEKNLYVNQLTYSTYMLNSELKIVKCDKEFENITGYTWEDVKGAGLGQADLIYEEDREYYFNLVQKSLLGTGELYAEHRLRRKDGSAIFVFCLGHGHYDEETGTDGFRIRITDVTKMSYMRLQAEAIRRENEEEVESLKEYASTDTLTGLLRRGVYVESVEGYLKKGVPLAMLMVDVDNFKMINDTYGHTVGDMVLQRLADIFRKVLRENDLVCRMGGDEFAIVLENISDKERVGDIIERIIYRTEKIRVDGAENLQVKISTGVKMHRGKEKNCLFNDLYFMADQALYQAKRQGKNQYVIYE